MASPKTGILLAFISTPLALSKHCWNFVRHSWKTGFTLLLFRTVVVGLVIAQDEPISCLEGRRRCHADTSCWTLLDSVQSFCDETMFTCTTSQRVRCHSVLSALQVSVHFRSCTCDPMTPDAVSCIELQKLIFLHACVSDDVTHPNITWIVPKPSSMRERSEPETDLNDPFEGHVSCIGVRKSCLLDFTCNEILREFRETCRENKKQGICVATEKQRCFNALEDLQSTAPEIFECTCRMKRMNTMEKCLHIQSRLANNTCRVSVPYFIHSAPRQNVGYNDLVRMVDRMPDRNSQDSDSTCVRAFMDCNYDTFCRVRMANFMDACAWNTSANGCERQECLDGIKNFYLLVRPEHAHSLLFCRCREEDNECVVMRQSMFPACSVVEEPPPSCIDLLRRCTADKDCRLRWKTYEKHCSYDLSINGCHGSHAQCRVAQAGIMGTILTTNCTCVHQDEEINTKCHAARKRLQNRNMCKELSIRDFQRNPPVVPPSAPWADGVAAAERSDCRRTLGKKIPVFMNVPAVIRRYNNGSDCSEVCQCHMNGTLMCIKLPCAANLSCKHHSTIHDHGASFEDEERGQCRCIKAEVVCAKSDEEIVPKQGLFLHVGYSRADQYLVEGYSDVRFRPEPISDKLGALMNGDSAEQFCRLEPYDKFVKNLVFEIKVAKSNPKADKKDGCVEPAKMISYMINNRQPPILTDAMLSILKVSQLERIAFHRPEGYKTEDSSGTYTTQMEILLIIMSIFVHI